MNLTTFNSNVATMSSLEIAELTGSSHDNVLKTVRNLIEQGVVFGNETTYIHEQNKQKYPMYLLDYRNTMVVVSGYSVELRAKIIDRWQELEAKQVEMLSPAEVLLRQAQMLVDIERRQRETEAAQAKTNERVARIEAKQQAFEDGASYFTVIGYAVWRNLPSLDLKSAAAIGKIATRISKEENSMIDRVKDLRFGTVNAYHESVLEKAVSEFMS